MLEHEADPFTVVEARELVRYWQKALNLEDWKITVAVVDQIDNAGTQGSINWEMQRRCAYVEILHPSQYGEASCWVPEDSQPKWYRFEKTICHELLHAVILPLTHKFSSGSADVLFEEHAVVSLSDALMSLKYPHPTWTKPGTAYDSAPNPAIAWFALEDIPQFSHVSFDDASGAVRVGNPDGTTGKVVHVPGFGLFDKECFVTRQSAGN